MASYIEAVLDEAGFAVVGGASSAAEALALAAEHRPIVALLDIELVGPIDGIELAGLLRERYA